MVAAGRKVQRQSSTSLVSPEIASSARPRFIRPADRVSQPAADLAHSSRFLGAQPRRPSGQAVAESVLVAALAGRGEPGRRLTLLGQVFLALEHARAGRVPDIAPPFWILAWMSIRARRICSGRGGQPGM